MTETSSVTSWPAWACWGGLLQSTAYLFSRGKYKKISHECKLIKLSHRESLTLPKQFKNSEATFLLFVHSLLEDRVTRLHGQLQRHQQQLLASPASGSIDNKVLDDLYEDIHWLILVTG